MLGGLRRASPLVAIAVRSTSHHSPLQAAGALARSMVGPKKPSRQFDKTAKPLQAPALAHTASDVVEEDVEGEVDARRPATAAEADQASKHGAITTFGGLAERGLVNESIIRTVTERMHITDMTQVQSMTINETLKGSDVSVEHLACRQPPSDRL